MEDRNKLLESLGLGVSDGVDLDWKETSDTVRTEPDRRLIRDLQSLSLIAGFYRGCRGIETVAETVTETDILIDSWGIRNRRFCPLSKIPGRWVTEPGSGPRIPGIRPAFS